MNIDGAFFLWDTTLASQGHEFLVAPGNEAQLLDADGKVRVRYVGHSGKVLAVGFSAHGERVVTGSYDRTAKVWSRSGAPIATLRGHEAPVRRAAFDHSGERVVTGSYDSTIRIWNAHTGALIKTLRDRAVLVTALAVSPDDRYLVAGYQDGSIAIWHPSGSLIARLRGHRDEVSSIAVLDDGDTIVTSSYDGTIRKWNTRYAVPRVVLTAAEKDVFGVAWSPDGEKLATASRDGKVRLWRKDGTLERELGAHEQPTRSVAFSGDGTLLVSASEDKSAIVWSVNTEAKLKLCCHDDVVSGARFVPKTHQVITAGYDGAAILWNETGSPQKRFAGPVVKLYSMDISSDGALLATASADARVTIWDIATGVTKTVLSHPQAVRTVIFDTPEQVITGDYAGVVRIWPIGSDRPAREIVWQRSVIRGIALARDGVTLATGSEDHTSVIGSKSGDVRQRMAGADDHVTSVDFSPVDMQVAVGSKDRNVYIYRVQPDFNALSEAQLHIASASANDQ